MSQYTGPDEYTIKEIPSTPLWSENYAAMYSDPATRVAVFYSIGSWHSDPTLWREVIMVSLPDQRILFHRGYARNRTPTGVGGGLSFYEILEPGQAVRLTFDGPMIENTTRQLLDKGAIYGPAKRVKLDLRFDSAAPLWNMKGDSASAMTIAGAIHIDHIGRVNGTIEYDGRTYPFTDGYVARDHSRGVRESSKFAQHCWINGIFPGGRAFYVYAMRLTDSDKIDMSNAAVAQGDKLYPATLKHTELISSARDAGKTHRVVLGCELGDMEVQITEVLNTLPCSVFTPYDSIPGAAPQRRAIMSLDESVRMRWDGKDGVGWSERGVIVGENV